MRRLAGWLETQRNKENQLWGMGVVHTYNPDAGAEAEGSLRVPGHPQSYQRRSEGPMRGKGGEGEGDKERKWNYYILVLLENSNGY